MAMREGFEIWAESQGYNIERYADDDHGYISSDTCEVWDAWQASRDTLTIELPECWNEQHADYKSDLIDVLDRAGVNYK